MNLGLTNLQAKIFITLFRLGGAGEGVRKISRESNIARQDIYRLLPSLQKMGLVQKIIAEPTLYKATPLETGFSMLLNQKTEEYHEMRTKATALFTHFMESSNPKVEPKEEAQQFTITSGRSLLLKSLGKIFLKAQTSIDVISSVEGINLTLFYALPHMKKTIERGVKVRIITDQRGKGLFEKNAKELRRLNLSDFQVRYVSSPIPVGMAIFDGTQASICVTSDQIVPSLWTNNLNVLTLASNYFEGIWAKSKIIELASTTESQATELSN